MRFELSFGERWVLESARQTVYPLALLAAPPAEATLHYNTVHHGLFGPDLWDAVLRLCRLGLLELIRSDLGDAPDEILMPADAAAVRALCEYEDPPHGPGRAPRPRWRAIGYRLTPAGGAAWERFAGVDWDLFHHSFHRHWGFKLTAGRRMDILHTLAPREETLAVVLRAGTFSLKGRVDLRTRPRWGVIRPFRATYWKTLPVGHRLSVRVHRRFGRASRDGYRRERARSWPARWWPAVYAARVYRFAPPWFRTVDGRGGW